MKDGFPDVQGGGSLMLAWQVRNRNVLVIGGGEVAAGRILNALNADARVTVLAPRDGLNDEVAHRVACGQVTYIDREFQPEDLTEQSQSSATSSSSPTASALPPSQPDDSASDPTTTTTAAAEGTTTAIARPAHPIAMVLAAIDSPSASTQIHTLCKRQRIPVNVADVPPECDFYFGSVHRDGPLQIMVSTNGNGPRLANLVRRRIASALPANAGAAVRRVGALRRRLRRRVPRIEEGAKRMRWMSKVCDEWTLEELCGLDEADMEALLEFYESGEVPRLEELRGQEQIPVVGFCGAFGWW